MTSQCREGGAHDLRDDQQLQAMNNQDVKAQFGGPRLRRSVGPHMDHNHPILDVELRKIENELANYWRNSVEK